MRVRHVVLFLACLVATYAVEEMNSQKKKARERENPQERMASGWSSEQISGLH